MGTKRNQLFYERAIKRMNLMGLARQTKDAMTILIEECRNSQEVLNPALLALERELEGLCYPEYAFMTPYQRDKAFVDAMNDAAKTLWSRHRVIDEDDETASELTYGWVKPLELNTPEVRSAIRSARQHYDAKGLQYRPAISWVIKQGIQYKGGHGLPSPNQLYSHLALDALEADDEHVRERFEAPFTAGVVDQRFLALNYVGHWAQDKALDVIEGYVRCQNNLGRALGRYLAEGLISEEEARRRFGDDRVDDTINEFGIPQYSANGDADDPPRTDLRACLGLSYDLNVSICAECSVRNECAEVIERVRLAQIAAYGVEDPRTEFQRQDTARRQRNARARRTPEHKEWAAAIRTIIGRIVGLDMTAEAPPRRKSSRKKMPDDSKPS